MVLTFFKFDPKLHCDIEIFTSAVLFNVTMVFTLCMCLLNGDNYFAVHIYILSLLLSIHMFVRHICYCLFMYHMFVHTCEWDKSDNVILHILCLCQRIYHIIWKEYHKTYTERTYKDANNFFWAIWNQVVVSPYMNFPVPVMQNKLFYNI